MLTQTRFFKDFDSFPVELWTLILSHLKNKRPAICKKIVISQTYALFVDESTTSRRWQEKYIKLLIQGNKNVFCNPFKSHGINPNAFLKGDHMLADYRLDLIGYFLAHHKDYFFNESSVSFVRLCLNVPALYGNLLPILFHLSLKEKSFESLWDNVESLSQHNDPNIRWGVVKGLRNLIRPVDKSYFLKELNLIESVQRDLYHIAQDAKLTGQTLFKYQICSKNPWSKEFLDLDFTKISCETKVAIVNNLGNALKYLDSYRHNTILNYFMRFSRDNNYKVRLAVVRTLLGSLLTLNSIAYAQSLGCLKRYSKDPIWEVRFEVVNCVIHTIKNSKRGGYLTEIQFLKVLCQDEDLRVRIPAVQGLASLMGHLGKGEVDKVWPVLENLTQDSNFEIRGAVAIGLKNAISDRSGYFMRSKALELLNRLSTDSKGWVRIHAAGVLTQVNIKSRNSVKLAKLYSDKSTKVKNEVINVLCESIKRPDLPMLYTYFTLLGHLSKKVNQDYFNHSLKDFALETQFSESAFLKGMNLLKQLIHVRFCEKRNVFFNLFKSFLQSFNSSIIIENADILKGFCQKYNGSLGKYVVCRLMTLIENADLSAQLKMRKIVICWSLSKDVSVRLVAVKLMFYMISQFDKSEQIIALRRLKDMSAGEYICIHNEIARYLGRSVKHLGADLKNEILNIFKALSLSDNPFVRIQIAKSLSHVICHQGYFEGYQGIKLLFKLLSQDMCYKVRLKSISGLVFSLEKLSLKEWRLLKNLSKSKLKSIRKEIAVSLCHINMSSNSLVYFRYSVLLNTLLNDKKKSIRCRAARAFFKGVLREGFNNNDLTLLEALCKDKKPCVRKRTAIGLNQLVLARFKGEQVFQSLKLLSQDPLEEVRFFAVKGLLQWVVSGGGGKQIANKHLKCLCQDLSQRVSLVAAQGYCHSLNICDLKEVQSLLNETADFSPNLKLLVYNHISYIWSNIKKDDSSLLNYVKPVKIQRKQNSKNIESLVESFKKISLNM